MICIVPTPPSQARMVDCQPLSCQATAYIRFDGTVMVGALVGQKRVAPALSSAVRTAARLAPVPVWLGQAGLLPLADGCAAGLVLVCGGGGSATWVGFFDGAIMGLGLLGAALGDALRDAEALLAAGLGVAGSAADAAADVGPGATAAARCGPPPLPPNVRPATITTTTTGPTTTAATSLRGSARTRCAQRLTKVAVGRRWGRLRGCIPLSATRKESTDVAPDQVAQVANHHGDRRLGRRPASWLSSATITDEGTHRPGDPAACR
jgi:hypothetical protein